MIGWLRFLVRAEVGPRRKGTAATCIDMPPAADETLGPNKNTAPTFIAESWPLLPPHVKESIITLIDASLSLARKG